MAKLTKLDKRDICIMRASGSTLELIAKKFNVSINAISKILKSEKVETQLKEVENKVEIATQQVDKSLTEQAHAIIKQIINGIPFDLEEASVKDKMIVFDRLVAYFGLPEDDTKQITEITLNVVDASKGETDEQED